MITIRRITVPLAIIVALAAAPALSGCSMVQGAIEQATGGTVDIGGTTVPDDFPAEVPLFDGPIVNGSSITADGSQVWNVIVTVPDATVWDGIQAALEGAGFVLQNEGAVAPSADGATGVFDGEKYGVLVVVAKTGDTGFVANYTVTTK